MINKNKHHPALNKHLLYKNEFPSLDISKEMKKAAHTFCLQRIVPNRKNSLINYWRKLLFLPFLQKRENTKFSTAYYIEEDGIPYPIWKKVLDQEEEKLEKTIKQTVDLTDFGGTGDGKTDNTVAFQKAIGSGNVKVNIPPGVFVVKGIKLPTRTILTGAGKGKTILKLHDKAPKRSRLVTNHSHQKGNHHIKVEELTLDWNVKRLKKETKKTSSGNNLSSCLTYANVTCGWVKRVEAINAGLHAFDISSTFYTYAGDGTQSKGASRFIWLDELTGYGFGDDGVTTHHSKDILISNSHMANPSGRAHKKGYSNSNGFEIDDGSQRVWLLHNSSYGCFGGIEIKAHKHASAAANVWIVGHLSVRDNRSFNFRHIGHHHKNEKESQTACDIIAVNLQAIEPVRTELYKDSSPRALVVSAYKNVVIHKFTAIGKANYDYHGQTAISIQYRARNVFLCDVDVRNFSTAAHDIQVTGGPQRADIVSINDVVAQNSAPVRIKVGKTVKNCTLKNIDGKIVR